MKRSLDSVCRGLSSETDISSSEAVAAFSALGMVVLADDVLGRSELDELLEELRGDWRVHLDRPQALKALRRLLDWPRQDLLAAIGEVLGLWPRERREALFRNACTLASTDRYVAERELKLLGQLRDALRLPDLPLPVIGAREGRADKTLLTEFSLAEGQTLRLGRSLDCEISLCRAPLAGESLLLEYSNGRLSFTAPSGHAVVSAGGRTVSSGDIGLDESFSVGRYRAVLHAEPARLAIHDARSSLRLEVSSVGLVRDGKTIVDGVTFDANAGELIAIVGPSGSGKSSLLSVVNGMAHASAGVARLDGVPIEPGADATVRRISFVPQDELLLPALTVEESVTTSARLKGLQLSSTRRLADWIDEVLNALGLGDRHIRRMRIGDKLQRTLSGGQRRRVSVAQELVGGDTDILLLDEPTSGLDPRSEANVIRALRDLAGQGRIVIVATHSFQPETFTQFDKVLCLTGDGRMAYFGSIRGLFAYFQVATVEGLFEKLEDWPAEQPVAAADHADRRRRSPDSPRRPLPFLRRVGVLTARHLRLRLRDTPSLLLTFAVPAAVLVTSWAVYRPRAAEPSLYFVLGLAALWSGVSYTVRDLIFLMPVLRHETRTRTTLSSNYLAIVLVATLASFVQAAILTAGLFWLFDLQPVSRFADWDFDQVQRLVTLTTLVYPMALLGVLFATHLIGNAIGLLLSAVFRSSEAAVHSIPVALLPLIAFAGSIVPPRDMIEPVECMTRINPLYWSFVGTLGSTATYCQPQYKKRVRTPEACDDATLFSAAGGDGERFFMPTDSCLEGNKYARIHHWFNDTRLLREPEPDSAEGAPLVCRLMDRLGVMNAPWAADAGPVDSSGQPRHRAIAGRALLVLLAMAAVLHPLALFLVRRRLVMA